MIKAIFKITLEIVLTRYIVIIANVKPTNIGSKFFFKYVFIITNFIELLFISSCSNIPSPFPQYQIYKLPL